MESCRLLTTARNILELYINLSPIHHQQALVTVPQIAAVFFNNCHYICHRLAIIQMELQQSLVNVSKLSASDLDYASFFAELKLIATNILEQHIVQVRRQLSATLGESDGQFSFYK